MTEASRKAQIKWMFLGALLAGSLLAGAALLRFLLAASDEDGIRVKNGSVYFETTSGAGFEEDVTAGEYKTKKKTKSCYHVAVNHGTCEVFLAEKAATITLTVRNDVANTTSQHNIVDKSSKFSLKKGEWKLSTSNQLTYGGENDYLQQIQAFNKQGVELLNCTRAAPARMEAHLAVCK